MQRPVTPELIRAALDHLPAALPRHEWARVAMAIKSEFPDSIGFDLFDAWSQQAGDRYDSKACKSTWRSVKGGGGVGIGTLLHMAKEAGFQLSKDHAAAIPPDPETLAAREREQAQRQRDELARRDAAHALAAIKAAEFWAQALPVESHAYLADKQVKPHGLRIGGDGSLLLPVRDAQGALWNLQCIRPDGINCTRPVEMQKRFLKGGRKSGLWHTLHAAGDDADAREVIDAAGVLLIAEGFATAASLHETTGQPVVCAFDAGNLAPVAKALRQRHPTILLVLCGDDDRDTEAKTGTNTGRSKATAAARAVGGLAVFPEPLPEGKSDFNDLHQAAGPDAVRAIVEAAIDAHRTARMAAGSATDDATGLRHQQATNARRETAKDDESEGNAFDPFTLDDEGVWHQGMDQNGRRGSPSWICSRLELQAQTRDADGGAWGYLLTFDDPLGNAKQWAMPARMLSGDGGEYRATLLHMGLRIGSTPKARNLLTQYVQSRAPDEFAICTDRIGWHGKSFVLPRETIGTSPERIVFQTDNAVENTFRSRGSVEQWRERVGALCVGNSRLVFAVACAFAGPLLRPAGMESGGFHLRGDSSSGKTTALKLAARVYGGENYLQRWRTTDNALEAIAAAHNDCLLILDELAQVDPRTAGECAYMLANGSSKGRATRNVSLRARMAWRMLFLSAGEVGLADHMAEGMKRTRTGQEVRMADIPADAGAGLGAFERLHNHEGGAAFARHLARQAAAVYGAPGRAWMEWLCENADTLKDRIRSGAQALGMQMIPEAASGQVQRVGERFALVGAAGELATEAGLTGWPAGESERSARACFDAWLAARGGIGNGEVTAMLRAVTKFVELNGEGRFT